MKHTRGALALSAIALTLAMLVTGTLASPQHNVAQMHYGTGHFASVQVAELTQLLPSYDVQLASTDKEPPRSASETLAAVAVGCGVLAVASLAFFILEDCGRRKDDD